MRKIKTKSKIEFSNGYTLIEMLISVAILAAVVGGGIAAYLRYYERQLLVNAGSEFVVSLREVQKRAQSGEKPRGTNCDTSTLQGWRMNLSNDSYNFGAVCANAIDEYYVQVEERNLNGEDVINGDVAFDLSDGNQIEFEVLTGMVTGLSEVTLTSGANSYKITVSSVGGISNDGIQ